LQTVVATRQENGRKRVPQSLVQPVWSDWRQAATALPRQAGSVGSLSYDGRPRVPPHPPFGHLLPPGGEGKDGVATAPRQDTQDTHALPLFVRFSSRWASMYFTTTPLPIGAPRITQLDNLATNNGRAPAFEPGRSGKDTNNGGTLKLPFNSASRSFQARGRFVVPPSFRSVRSSPIRQTFRYPTSEFSCVENLRGVQTF
jgi:hypothetical protein